MKDCDGDLEPSDYHHEAEGYMRWRVERESERKRAARRVRKKIQIEN